MKLITRVLIVSFALVFKCANASEEMRPVTIRAFGGDVPIPEGFRVRIQERLSGLVEARLLQTDVNGGVRKIVILYKDQDEQQEDSHLSLVSEYELNGFRVRVFRPIGEFGSFTTLLSASIRRCGDWGQVVFAEVDQLNEFVNSISHKACEADN